MNSSLLIVLAAIIAVAAAMRSTWSPCGLSMLSTITPMAERSRGRNWWATTTWFLLGATAGGASLGVLAALGAVLVAVLAPSTSVVLAVAAAAALVTVALDLGVARTTMPHHRRQVNEQWLDQFRSWVYGAGFGWQIGTGLATYIMTAAVYLTVVLAALTGSPLVAFGIGVLFGVIRGLAIFLGARLTDPVKVAMFHFRFEELGPLSRRLLIGVQAAVGVTAATASVGPVGAAAALVVTGLLVASATRLDTSLTPSATGREPVVAEA